MFKQIFLLVSLILLLVTTYMIFMWVPTELNLGISQRIFYYHVPLAWIGMISIFIVGIASVIHLITKDYKWDAIAHSSAEIGVVFATLILVTGALWAKPAWGVWWSWDPKLTTTLILWFIYVAYLMIRSYSTNQILARRYASVVAVLGAIDAPLIYLASIWWRNLHPRLNIGPLAESDSSLDSRMLLTLLVSTISFTVFYIYMLIERIKIRRIEDDLDEVHKYASNEI